MNNIDKFLSSLDSNHKKNILDNCKNNSDFNKFISCCVKLNISLFNNDNFNTPKNYSYLLKKMKDYKEVLVRSFGGKVMKEYEINCDNIINFINDNFKKLEIKINYIDFLINYLENEIDEGNLVSLLSNNHKICINKKINYTEDTESKKVEILDLTQEIFITSDELSSSDENCESVNLIYSQNTPFIAEYSN